MPIDVIMPDGSVRQFPSRRRPVESREIPAGPTQVLEEPLPHRDWEFYEVIGIWRARPH